MIVPNTLVFMSTLLLVSNAIAAQETVEFDQVFECDSKLWKAAKTATLDEKQRLKLGMMGYGNYLEELLIKDDKASVGLKRSEFKPLLQKLNKKFVGFVPSFQVEALEKSFLVKVKLAVATKPLLTFLKQEGVTLSNSISNNANTATGVSEVKSSPTNPSDPKTTYQSAGALNQSNNQAVTLNSNNDAKTDSFPYASFLFDEKNKTIYVTPPKAISQFALDKADSLPLGYKLKPAALRIAKRNTESYVNSLDTPLDERATLFSQRLLGNLNNPKLVTRPAWAADILKFILTSANVESLKSKPHAPRVWPLALPWTFSTLYDNPGVVSVFVVRSDDRAGTLERAEVVGFSGVHYTRQYWSRSQNDPTYLETPSRAVDRIALGFTRTAKQKKPQMRPQNLEFFVDKAVGDREILSVESIIRPFALGHEHLLIPKSVDAKGIRYATPLGSEQTQKILERLNRALEKGGVLAESSRVGHIELLPKTSHSDKSKTPIPETR